MFKRIFIALSAVIGLLNSCDCTLLANDPNEPILHFYNIPLTGIIDEGYSASIDIGTPAQTVRKFQSLFSFVIFFEIIVLLPCLKINMS